MKTASGRLRCQNRQMRAEPGLSAPSGPAICHTLLFRCVNLCIDNSFWPLLMSTPSSHTSTNMMAKSSPTSPAEMDWSKHFPAFIDTQRQASASPTPTSPPALTKKVEIADVGCGFGGLLVALSPLFPNTLMLGLFIPRPYHTARPLIHYE